MTLIPIASKTTRTPVATDLVPLSPDGNAQASDIAKLNGPNTMQIGSLLAFGHSYLVGSSFALSGTDYMEQTGLLASLAGMLDVVNENIVMHAIGATSLTSTTNVNGVPLGGWAGVLQLCHPNNATHMASLGVVLAAVPRSQPGVGVLVHGLNDVISGVNEWNSLAGVSNGRNAWSHALRSTISRVRAGCLWCSKSPAGTVIWDPIFAFGGTWSDVAGINGTAGARKGSSTNTNTVTITLPADLLPGTYAVCFIAQLNAQTTLSGAMTNVQTTLPATAFLNFPASGTYVARILTDGTHPMEEVLVTAGAGTNTWTVTRGVNGTSAVAHNSGSQVIISPAAAKVTWSTNGSNATITGTTQLGGQGWAGQQVPVVTRFVLTAADAGKTIVGTVGSIVSGDTSAQVQFDSFWMESPDPTPFVIMNTPRYAYAGANFKYADIATLNADTLLVAAEFDGAVQVADVDTFIWNHGCVANGATGTTGTIAVTANDNATFAAMMNAVPFVPFRMSNNGVEDIWVTAIASTGGSNYNLTCTRGYNATTPTSSASGSWLGWGAYFANDNLHPNAYGHPWMAQQMFLAMQKLAVSSTQLARAAGNWMQNARVPVLDAATATYIMPICASLPVSVALAVTRLSLVPVFIPRDCVIREIGCSVGTLNAGSTIAMGIYDVEPLSQRPGAKLYDCGTISGGTVGVRAITGIDCRHRGGWLYLAVLQTGTAASIMCIPRNGLSYPLIPYSTPVAAMENICGYNMAGQSTLPVAVASLVEVVGAQTTTNAAAMVYCRTVNA